MALSIETHPWQKVPQQQTPQPQTNVLACKGIIVYGDEATELRARVKDLLAQRGASPSMVVLDLSGVRYVDSGGVGTLVGLLTSLRSAGGELVLVAPNERVRQVLKITHLIDVFKIYASVEEAVKTSAGGAAGGTVPSAPPKTIAKTTPKTIR